MTEIRTRKVRENVSKIEDLLNVIDWFQNSLKVIFPDDKYNEGLRIWVKAGWRITDYIWRIFILLRYGIDGVCLENWIWEYRHS